jgi:hypothetical protein
VLTTAAAGDAIEDITSSLQGGTTKLGLKEAQP